MVSITNLKNIANVLRRDVAIMTTHAKSGHPTSCFSCAEIISNLFFEEMHYDIKNPNNPDNDEFILSKGHAAPILYAALFRAKAMKANLNTLRDLTSKYQGHPMPQSFPWSKVATGSLGQGLSAGIGMALAARLQNKKYRTYVLLGDSEMAEGSVWEAFQLASYYKLSNLCAIIDVNRLGQRGQTMLGHNVKAYKKRCKSFGWNTLVVNGHNTKQIRSALNHARTSNKPTAIIAKTFKGKGVSFLENKQGWHGKAMDDRHLGQALDELPHVNMPKIKIKKPKKTKIKKQKTKQVRKTKYQLGKDIATREAYGESLANLAISNNNIISLDGEVSNSTKSDKVKKVVPKQFLEMFIAEQNMIGVALGLSVKNIKPFASTFAAFLTRAHDQIRMAALSNANLTISGSHAGASIGEDGASQMGLGDIAMFRNFPNSNVLYPSDAVSCRELTHLASKIKGITYIRTTRPKTNIIYKNNESFPLGDFKVIKQSKKDKAVLAGSGITTHECLKAQKKLKNVAVVDIYCVKPFNINKFAKFIKAHGNKLILSEDHFQEGGIGEMLASGLRNTNIKTKLLNIKEIPHSGTKEQLLKKYQIDSNAIIQAFKKI
jgi:transketolase